MSLFDFNPQVKINLFHHKFISKSRAVKMSFRFDNKMFLNVLSYALKKNLKDNDKDITEANI